MNKVFLIFLVGYLSLLRLRFIHKIILLAQIFIIFKSSLTVFISGGLVTAFKLTSPPFIMIMAKVRSISMVSL